jgi:hypothetical protein
LIPTLNSARTTRLLFACCIIQIAGCVYFWLSFAENGYLPSPFVYDKADTFMDFFHSMYWADEPGRYTDWNSVYPPLNFLFLKGVRWLLFGQVHESDAFTLRDSAKPFIPYIVAAFAASPLFAFRHDLWRGFTATQKALLFISCLLSPPMLFTIERGNLIIFALGFLALALAKPGWTRTFAIGMLINIKPYFALYLVAFAISQRPRELVSCTMMAGAIFLVSGIFAAFFSLGLGGRRIPVETTLAATTIAITNLAVWVGGYSFILYVCLIPILFRLTYYKVYLACVFLILMPIDVITLFRENLGNHYAYLSDTAVPVEWQLSLGAFLRPAVNFGLLLMISFEIFRNYAHSPLVFLKNFRAAVRKKSLPRQIAAHLEHKSTRPA